MGKIIEIPLGKRTKLYRFLEILPGVMSYGMIVLLFVLSMIEPVLGSMFLLLLTSVTLIKAIGTAFRTIQGHKTLQAAMRVEWDKRYDDLKNPKEAYERLKNEKSEGYHFKEHVSNVKKLAEAREGEYVDPNEVYHAVIMVAYNEGLETLIPTVEAVKNTNFPNERIIFVLGYEARGGEQMRENAKKLEEKFRGTFFDFILSEHPEDLPNEIVGKGPNLTFAGKKLSEFIRGKKVPVENVIVTSLDSDNRMHEDYLDSVAYEFVVHKERQNLSYQPVAIFTNNVWDAPAPSRVVAISNSFFNVITTMKPHALRNFASHSQPLLALEQMHYWSKRTIVEDGHQYWRSLFFFNGSYDVLPIRIPIYQDAVISETFWETLTAQFVQLRRWDYGASDVAYVGSELFSKDRQISFWLLLPKFIRLLDGHVTCAYMAPIVAFGGWVPMIVNMSSRGMVVFNLPNIVSIVQTFALIGVVITIWTSFKLLPSRPKQYKKRKNFEMVLQWILMPIVALFYTSFAAFYSQTRLMFGKYMEKFDVTKKVVKK